MVITTSEYFEKWKGNVFEIKVPRQMHDWNPRIFYFFEGVVDKIGSLWNRQLHIVFEIRQQNYNVNVIPIDLPGGAHASAEPVHDFPLVLELFPPCFSYGGGIFPTAISFAPIKISRRGFF